MRRLYLALLISACALFAQTDAPGWLDRGVQAFKNARYDEATDAFQHSVDLDPSNLKARLYLATVFFAQYIPGATSPENVAFAEKARAEFEHVLTIEPDNKTAMQYLASIAYQTASGTADLDEKFHRLDEARGWYEKLIAADPQNKEAWYSLGVIDSTSQYEAGYGAPHSQFQSPAKAQDQFGAACRGWTDEADESARDRSPVFRGHGLHEPPCAGTRFLGGQSGAV
ncbi:MAG: hypothetical protein ABSB67_17790 [Bryobacteraceae bacterium]